MNMADVTVTTTTSSHDPLIKLPTVARDIISRSPYRRFMSAVNRSKAKKNTTHAKHVEQNTDKNSSTGVGISALVSEYTMDTPDIIQEDEDEGGSPYPHSYHGNRGSEYWPTAGFTFTHSTLKGYNWDDLDDNNNNAGFLTDWVSKPVVSLDSDEWMSGGGVDDEGEGDIGDILVLSQEWHTPDNPSGSGRRITSMSVTEHSHSNETMWNEIEKGVKPPESGANKESTPDTAPPPVTEKHLPTAEDSNNNNIITQKVTIKRVSFAEDLVCRPPSPLDSSDDDDSIGIDLMELSDFDDSSLSDESTDPLPSPIPRDPLPSPSPPTPLPDVNIVDLPDIDEIVEANFILQESLDQTDPPSPHRVGLGGCPLPSSSGLIPFPGDLPVWSDVTEVSGFIDCGSDVLHLSSDAPNFKWPLLIDYLKVPDNFDGCIVQFDKPSCYIESSAGRKPYEDFLQESGVWGVFGCHPCYSDQYSLYLEMAIHSALTHSRAAGVGCCGLDYSDENRVECKRQKVVFQRQMFMALTLRKPLLVYCNKAEHVMLELFRTTLPYNYPIHRTAYREGPEIMWTYLKSHPNLYIGFGTELLLAGFGALRRTARVIPLNRLLLESQSDPRGAAYCERKYNPSLVLDVAKRVAELKGISVNTVLHAARENTRRLYGI